MSLVNQINHINQKFNYGDIIYCIANMFNFYKLLFELVKHYLFGQLIVVF